jgi:hypothetical protein
MTRSLPEYIYIDQWLQQKLSQRRLFQRFFRELTDDLMEILDFLLYRDNTVVRSADKNIDAYKGIFTALMHGVVVCPEPEDPQMLMTKHPHQCGLLVCQAIRTVPSCRHEKCEQGDGPQ